MKKIMMIIAFITVTTGFAQNTNKTAIETIKKTKITDNNGEEINTKIITTEKETELAIGENTYYDNYNTIMKPTEVQTDIDYYSNGRKFKFIPQKVWLYIASSEHTEVPVARLYPTSQKGYYIYIKDGNSSFGYFNADGDFIVESYDSDKDGVINYVYKINVDTPIIKDKVEEKMKK